MRKLLPRGDDDTSGPYVLDVLIGTLPWRVERGVTWVCVYAPSPRSCCFCALECVCCVLEVIYAAGGPSFFYSCRRRCQIVRNEIAKNCRQRLLVSCSRRFWARVRARLLRSRAAPGLHPRHDDRDTAHARALRRLVASAPREAGERTRAHQRASPQTFAASKHCVTGRTTIARQHRTQRSMPLTPFGCCAMGVGYTQN